MIDFEEELKKFQPSLEVEEAEEAIYSHNLTDMTDILQEMIKEARRNRLSRKEPRCSVLNVEHSLGRSRPAQTVG